MCRPPLNFPLCELSTSVSMCTHLPVCQTTRGGAGPRHCIDDIFVNCDSNSCRVLLLLLLCSTYRGAFNGIKTFPLLNDSDVLLSKEEVFLRYFISKRQLIPINKIFNKILVYNQQFFSKWQYYVVSSKFSYIFTYISTFHSIQVGETHK